jgi:hypothetical protein
MIGFDDGAEKARTLDGKSVAGINSNLTTTGTDITTAHRLAANIDIAFMGDTKGGHSIFRKNRRSQFLPRRILMLGQTLMSLFLG